MARTATGTAYGSKGRFYACVIVAGERKTYPVNVPDLEAARARARKLNGYARALEKAGKTDAIETILRDAGTQDEASMPTYDLFVERMTGGKYAPTVAVRVIGPTFKSLADDWTSGKLNERWPDVVKLKRSKANDEGRLAKWIYPHVGDVELASFTMDHAERVMRELPATVSGSTRRHVAQLIRRVMQLAEYPLRAIERSPIRKGFVPSVKRSSHLAYLYRDEDAALMSCEKVPFDRRLLWGFLAREGLRISEAVGAPATDDQPEQEPLRWHDFDLARGTVTICDFKTKERRSWVLAPTVAAVLAAVKKARKAKDSAAVFKVGATNNLPKKLRLDLVAAGITRVDLHTTRKVSGVAVSRRMRVHDLRGTFVTHAFAEGRSEAFIMDRTGHDTSADVNRYRRPARTLSELGEAGLRPLGEVLVQTISTGSIVWTTSTDTSEMSANPLILQDVPAKGIEPLFEESKSPAESSATGNMGDSLPNGAESLSSQRGPDFIPDAIEAALLSALDSAQRGGDWSTVARVAGELEGRRRARSEVIDLEAVRRARGAR